MRRIVDKLLHQLDFLPFQRQRQLLIFGLPSDGNIAQGNHSMTFPANNIGLAGCFQVNI